MILKRHPVLIFAGLPLVAGDFSPRLFDLTEQFAVGGGVDLLVENTGERPAPARPDVHPVFGP